MPAGGMRGWARSAGGERGAASRLPLPGRRAGTGTHRPQPGSGQDSDPLSTPAGQPGAGFALPARFLRRLACPATAAGGGEGGAGGRCKQPARFHQPAARRAATRGPGALPSSASPARLGRPREAAAEGPGAPGSALRYTAPGFGGSPCGAPIAPPSLTWQPSGAAGAQPSAGVCSRSPLPERPGRRLGGASAGTPEAP